MARKNPTVRSSSTNQNLPPATSYTIDHRQSVDQINLPEDIQVANFNNMISVTQQYPGINVPQSTNHRSLPMRSPNHQIRAGPRKIEELMVTEKKPNSNFSQV